MAEESAQKTSPLQKVKEFLEKLSMGAWVGITVVALVIGLLIGNFALGGASGSALNKTSLTEAELDTVVATYTRNGGTNSITAREVIEMTSSLESSKDEEGNYTVPSADNILYAVRNTIAIDEAESRGINPTDEELLDYAEQTLGQTPDFESIATSNNLDVDTVKKLLTDSYRIHELQVQVGGEMTATEPEYPTEPEYATTKKVTNEETGEETEEDLSDEELEAAQEAAYNEPKKEYAEYIIGLAGDEWDAEKNTWADPEGAYAQALADYEVTNDAATFLAAYAAYQVAYSDYSDAQTAYYDGITQYLSELYGDSTITILTLAQ